MEQEVVQPARALYPERRHHERLPASSPIRITRVGECDTCLDGACTDVSVGGIGFNSGAALPVGETIEFEFAHADHSALRFHARVMYRNGEHYGAYYLNAR